MPKGKKGNLRQQHKQKKAMKPGGANNYFETAEELANRHRESEGQSQRKMQKQSKPAENPEEPK